MIVEFYTDGASRGNPGIGAAGFYCKTTGHYYCESHDRVTNNREELMAIYYALIYAIDKNYFNDNIKIYSDSAWSIGALSRGWNISINLELVNEIKKLISKFNKVEFVKVKGHSGNNDDNDYIDKLLNKLLDSGDKIISGNVNNIKD